MEISGLELRYERSPGEYGIVPIEIDFDYDQCGKKYWGWSNDLNVFSADHRNLEDVILDIWERIVDQYDGYANDPDENLDQNALGLKHRLLGAFPNGVDNIR